jgi:hypothetical protein
VHEVLRRCPFARRSTWWATTAAATLGVAWGLPLVAALVSGCGEEASNATQGQRIRLATRVESGEDLSLPFTTATGWSVTLNKALVSLQAIYYFSDAPPHFARSSPRQLRPLQWVGLNTALAHPGHYHPESALGEMLVPATVDLLAGPAQLAAADAITGTYRSAEVRLFAATTGEFAKTLDGSVIVVEGVARKAAEERVFRAAASAEAFAGGGYPSVIGCVFEEADVRANGTVVVRISPSVWLDQVDFTSLPPSEEGEPANLPPESQPAQAFERLGVTRANAYRFKYEEQS